MPVITNRIAITAYLIDALVAEAQTNSPALKAASARVRAATLEEAAIKTWEDPMGIFGGSVYSSRGFSPSEDGNLAYGIEQKLPMWGRPKSSRYAAKTGTMIRQSELRYRSQQTRNEIIKALVATALAERIVEIGEQDLGWLQATTQAAESKYRAGQGSVADLLQVQNETAKRADTLQTQRLQLAHARFALNRILNRDPGSGWPTLELPSVAPGIPLSEKLLATAEKNEPKLEVLASQIKQAEAALQLTRKMRLPDVSVGVEGRQYSGDGAFRSGMFTLRFSLPWINGDKYRKAYQRDEELRKSAEEERQEQILILREELHHLAVGIESSRRDTLLQSGEINDRALQALNSRLNDWSTGHGTFRDVLDARRTVIESLLMTARSTAEEHQMLADMLFWTGLDNLEALVPFANEPPLLPDHGSHAANPTPLQPNTQ